MYLSLHARALQRGYQAGAVREGPGMNAYAF
jgi:hypothetical protein